MFIIISIVLFPFSPPTTKKKPAVSDLTVCIIAFNQILQNSVIFSFYLISTNDNNRMTARKKVKFKFDVKS